MDERSGVARRAGEEAVLSGEELIWVAVWIIAVLGWTRARRWRAEYERLLVFSFSQLREELPERDRDYYRQVLRGL
jgi:hypothetical protein